MKINNVLKIKIAIAVWMLCFLAVASCKDSSLDTVAKTLSDTAFTVGTLQTTVIQANGVGLVSDADTQRLLNLTSQINVAGKNAVDATRKIAKLSNPDRQNLLNILGPVIAAVDKAVKDGTTGIKDPKKKQEIQLLLVSIQTYLTTINTALVVK